MGVGQGVKRPGGVQSEVWEFHVEQERQGCYLGMKRPLEGNFSDTFALRYSLELWNAVSPQRVDSGSFEPIPVGPAVIQ